MGFLLDPSKNPTVPALEIIWCGKLWTNSVFGLTVLPSPASLQEWHQLSDSLQHPLRFQDLQVVLGTNMFGSAPLLIWALVLRALCMLCWLTVPDGIVTLILF